MGGVLEGAVGLEVVEGFVGGVLDDHVLGVERGNKDEAGEGCEEQTAESLHVGLHQNLNLVGVWGLREAMSSPAAAGRDQLQE